MSYVLNNLDGKDIDMLVGYLSAGPYREVSRLIEKITLQVSAQAEARMNAEYGDLKPQTTQGATS